MAYTFTVIDPAKSSDDEIAEVVELSNRLSAELMPEDPPTPVEVALAAHRAVPERIRRISIRARDDSGQLVGSTGVRFDPEHDDNPDVLWCHMGVDADHRRRQVGSRLVSYLVAIARQEGRVRMIGSTNERAPAGEALARSMGATSKQANHLNHLPIDEVDRELMERWVAEGPERAAEYELFGWDGPVPQEHMEKYLDMVLVMNTAPRDDLEVNDFTITEVEVRDGERQFAAVKGEHWTLVARHRQSGEWAGFHDVSWMPSDPNVVWVGATGVRPEHRGHALGKWLKAAMTLRILDERPDVTSIRTGNADSNDAMLGINKQMGYRPLIGSTTWEISVDDAEKWLAGRGIDVPALPSL